MMLVAGLNLLCHKADRSLCDKAAASRVNTSFYSKPCNCPQSLPMFYSTQLLQGNTCTHLRQASSITPHLGAPLLRVFLLEWGWLKQITLTWSAPLSNLSIGEDINHVPGELTPLFTQLSHGLHKEPALWGRQRWQTGAVSWGKWRGIGVGRTPGVMHILKADTPQSIYVFYF